MNASTSSEIECSKTGSGLMEFVGYSRFCFSFGHSDVRLPRASVISLFVLFFSGSAIHSFLKWRGYVLYVESGPSLRIIYI